MVSRRRQCGNVPRPAVQVAGLDRDIVDLERHSKRAFIQGQTPPEPLCELRAALVALAERHGATGRTLACAPRVGCVHRVYNIVECCPKNTQKIAVVGSLQLLRRRSRDQRSLFANTKSKNGADLEIKVFTRQHQKQEPI